MNESIAKYNCTITTNKNQTNIGLRLLKNPSWYSLEMMIYSRADTWSSHTINFNTITKEDLLELSRVFAAMAGKVN